MAGEYGSTTVSANVNFGGFEQIVQQNFGPSYVDPPTEAVVNVEAIQTPFGAFTPGEELAADMLVRRSALATATGNTGNNCEESC